jgi:ATP-dependent phosphoenolpyruvate carboxykinase
VLYPAESWPSLELYNDKYSQLAARFIENFKKYVDDSNIALKEAGPKM